MDLLVAVMIALGFHYSPEQITSLSGTSNEELKKATLIIENHLYRYDADGGIVIEDGVNPQH